MKNIKLVISYQGSAYCGWQIQPNGLTIQEVLETAIEEVTGEKIQIMGSGRTDSGVHAYGQVANFYTESRIPPERFALAINTRLPKDIRIIESEEVEKEFHSRFSAKGKAYIYKIYEGGIDSPFYFDRAFHVKNTLDWEKIQDAARYFHGEHDFKAFMASGSVVKNTVRTIEKIEFHRNNDLWEMTFKGNGFLYNMVRIMVGTLYEVGRSRRKPEEIKKLILGLDRNKAGITAPAHGLYLNEVYY